MAGSLSPKLDWSLANPKWAASLNPVLGNPLVSGNMLPAIVLKSGSNTINHGLGRKLQGYMVVLIDSGVTIHDGQTTNQYPDLTLVLIASGAATVTLYVF